MKQQELEQLLEEIGMTPGLFCELVEEGEVITYFHCYHSGLHDDKTGGSKLKAYARRTSSLTTLKETPESELKTLATQLKTQPQQTRQEYEKLQTQYQQMRQAVTLLKTTLQEANQNNQQLINEVETLRTAAAEAREYKDQVTTAETFLESLYSLFQRFITNSSDFPEPAKTQTQSFLREFSSLSHSYSQ
jgi:DNA repair exonuclease SbcCD ATPase subunit